MKGTAVSGLNLTNARFRKVVKEHRPGTLENEMPTMLRICHDAYQIAIEDFRELSASQGGDNSQAVVSRIEAKNPSQLSG